MSDEEIGAAAAAALGETAGDGNTPSTPVAPEAPDTGASPEAGNEPTEATGLSLDMFYDVSKLPSEGDISAAEVQKIIKEAAGNYTKKTQELGDFKKYVEQAGGFEQVQEFLDQVTTPEGVKDFWVDIGKQAGLDEKQLKAMIEGQAAPESSETTDEKPQYMTKEDFRAEQERLREEEKAYSEIESTFKDLGVADDFEKKLVAQFATKYGRHIENTERLKRGYNDFGQWVDKLIERRGEEREKVAADAPAPTGTGATPSEPNKEFTSFEEAKKAFRNDMAKVAANKRAGQL